MQGLSGLCPGGELRTLVNHGFEGNSSAEFNRNICGFILAKSLDIFSLLNMLLPNCLDSGSELCTYFEMHSADWIIFKAYFLSKVFPLIASFWLDVRSQ